MASASTGWFNAGSSPTVQTICETNLVRSDTTITVYWTVTMKLPSSQSYLGTGSLELSCSCSGGGSDSGTIKSHNDRWSGTTEHSYSGSYTFSNSSTSTETFTIYFSSSSDYFSSSGIFSTSVSCSVNGWAAYFSRKPTLTLVSKTETTATFNWSTSEACSRVQYKINNGNWIDVETNINKTSGSFTITSGLAANTSYTIYGDFMRRDSGQWSTHGGYNVNTALQTYNYPNCTSGNNFIIGQQCDLQIYNPLNRTFDMIITIEGEETIEISDLTGTSYSGLNDVTTIDELYESIPNSSTGSYSVSIIYGTISTITKSNVGNYIVSNSDPIFTNSNFTYIDNNSVTANLTNGTSTSNIYINGYSNNHIEITTPAEAQNYAEIKGYRIVQGTKSYTYYLTGEETGNIELDVSNIDSSTFTVYAIDTRNNSTSVEITINNYLQYENLTIQAANVSRDGNGVLTDTTLTFDGTFWKNSFGNVTNHLTKDNGITLYSATYTYKLTTDSDYTVSEEPITVTENNDGTYSFSGNIRGDEGADGFDNANSYNIRLTVKDYLSTKVFYLTLGVGTPAIAIYKNNVAIGQKYDTTLGGALQVNGDIYRNGSLLGDGVPTGLVTDYDGNTVPNGWEEIEDTGEIYSSTEQRVGTDLDNGKAIYRKVFTFSKSTAMGSRSFYDIALGATIEDIFRIDGYWIDSNWSNRKNPLAGPGVYNYAYVSTWQIKDNNTFGLYFDSGTSGRISGKLIIEYTKA